MKDKVKYYREKVLAKIRQNKTLFSYLTVFALLQITIIGIKWGKPLIWDSNVYVGMGKAIFSGWQHGLWESFRPLTLPFISGFLWLLGMPLTNFPRFIGLLMSLVGLGAFYRYSAAFLDRDTALTGLMTLGAFAVYVKYSNFFLTGIFASALVLLALYMVTKEKYLISGVLSSMAFLTRFPAALIGPVVITYFSIRFYRNRDLDLFFNSSIRYGSGVLVLAIPFMVANQIMYGDFLHPIISGALIPAGNPDKYALGLWFVFESFRTHFYVMASALVFAPLGIFVCLKEDFDRHILPVLALVFFYFFFSMYPHKELRFALLFLPFVAYFSSKALHHIIHRQDYVSKKNAKWVFRVLLILAMVISASAVASLNNYVNQDRREFLERSRMLEGTVVSNSPEIVPYSEFKYIPVRPENLANTEDAISINSCTSMKDTGFCKIKQDEIDYIALNSCAWYCTPAIDNCRSKISSFTEQVEKDFEMKVNITGARCEYAIYGDQK